MKVGELINTVKEALTGVYPPEEVRSMALAVAEHLSGWSRTRILSDPSALLDGVNEEELHFLCERLRSQEPLQYVLGHTEFCGMTFLLEPGVLIPRPETEELTAWIVGDHRDARGRLRILDIGTGSGAIAVSIAKLLPAAEVTALDISARALETAARNAALNGVSVKFLRADVLAPRTDSRYAGPGYDIIVSNPPYIPHKEKAGMAVNVVEHEPPGALFVPDEDPLVFYRAIADHTSGMLEKDGSLYFEVHENQGRQVCEMLDAKGFTEIELRKDINEKPRMVKCRKR